MGDPFLRAYYSVYDMEYNRIGLVGEAETIKNQVSSVQIKSDKYARSPQPIE